VLGWGGYWAWDPVENAALIPWLVATAFIHSAVVQVKRGMLQAWNFVLVLATFALTILGTFLTRSSVVVSVHSFIQSGVGPALLVFFVLVLGGGFTLFALRGERVASLSRPETLASREGAFLVNNLLLTLFAFVVLVGTVYPVFVETFTGTQVSVGRPFFDRMAVPLAFGLLLAMGVGAGQVPVGQLVAHLLALGCAHHQTATPQARQVVGYVRAGQLQPFGQPRRVA